MKKLLIALSIATCTFVGMEAKDLSGVKIYINPGHGGYWNGGADSVFNEDGTRGGLMFLLADLERSVSVFGNYGMEEDGYEYIADDETGLTIYFRAELLENGQYAVDLGNLGVAVVEAAEPEKVIDAMDTIMTGTTDVTAEFIEALKMEQEIAEEY